LPEYSPVTNESVVRSIYSERTPEGFKVPESPNQQAELVSGMFDSAIRLSGNTLVPPNYYSASFDSGQKAIYVEGFGSSSRDLPKPNQELTERIEIPNAKLTEQETAELMASQRDIWKVHLDLPIENRVTFMAEIAARAANWLNLVSNYGEVLNVLRDESGQVSAEYQAQLNEKFGPLLWGGLPTFKFCKLDIEAQVGKRGGGDLVPNFIFYPKDLPGAMRTLENLSDIARKVGEGKDRIPRYSAPYISKDGHNHTSLSLAQGGGDVKNWLLSNGELDKYFDPKTNYAFMK